MITIMAGTETAQDLIMDKHSIRKGIKSMKNPYRPAICKDFIFILQKCFCNIFIVQFHLFKKLQSVGFILNGIC